MAHTQRLYGDWYIKQNGNLMASLAYLIVDDERVTSAVSVSGRVCELGDEYELWLKDGADEVAKAILRGARYDDLRRWAVARIGHSNVAQEWTELNP